MKTLYNRIPRPLWLFFFYMFPQLTVLGMGNRAGEGYLSTDQREQVYFILQIFVIGGYLTFFAVDTLLKGTSFRTWLERALMTVLVAGSAVMALAGKGSAFYLAVTFVTCFCMGYLGGRVHLRMSQYGRAGGKLALSMGGAMAGAILLQYLTQLQWGESPVLAVLQPGSLVLTLLLLKQMEVPGADFPQAPRTRRRSLLFACLIASSLLLVVCFFNLYIHHLQIKTGYRDYNVYTWPRLMFIPCYILFALMGDKRGGKLVPLAALCCTLPGMLGSVLIGSSGGAYWLNMCLFYVSLGGAVSYYYLTFWRLAPGTRHPALWAPMGRIIDSVMVLLTAGMGLSELSAPLVLGLDLGALALTIVLLAVSGGFDLTKDPEPEEAQAISPEEALERLREQFALTPRETQVLRELVMTEDKQAAISDRLSITIKATQKYVTSLYRKTGAATRSGLTDLFHRTLAGK